ncbi:ABC transporter substrate-binding protein [Adhaeribacter sp. BT258]|uniref:ABC transporter substrate-binding protein n=1 Tax=Adhaeribacter terrigena TaxID=2793070 RepID=A0ABS1C0U0_9BACT|nr:ABC transporter substrate-binding protein [Adhaeribacter terrigena]MBK0403021.1 ABC transporter substrate-binding protein [Adhaeribacter terrigena]
MDIRSAHGFISGRKQVWFLVGAAATVLIGVLYFRYFRPLYKPTYQIGIIVNSVELEPADLRAIQYIVGEKIKSVNAEGGINGHSVEAIYLDDKGSPGLLKKQVRQTIQNKKLIAYIGCKSSLRTLAIAPILAQHQVAFIGSFSLTNLTTAYPNIYSSEVGMRDVRFVLQELLKKKSGSAAFIGKKGDLYSEALLKVMEALAAKEPGFKVTSRFWYPEGYRFTAAETRKLASELKEKNDFLMLSLEQRSSNRLLPALWKEGLRIPVFCGLTDITQINSQSPFYRQAELYDINPVGIPGVLNMHLQQQHAAFRGKIPEGPKLEFQLGFGGRLADEIGLLQQAASKSDLPPEANIREKIVAGLKAFMPGQQIYRGWFADWYFSSERAFGGEPLLAWKPPRFLYPLLAPEQYLRTDSDSGYRKAPVLYANLDLLDISQINDEQGSFYATFYLELSSVRDLNIKNIDFTNAERNKINQQPLIEAKVVRRKKDQGGNNFQHYLYKVSGKFTFNPDLKKYPFDEQKFPITLQTSDALKTFLVQPPDKAFRDTIFEVSGWNYKYNYVGYDQDIITVDRNFGSMQRNIPSYKFSYVYEMQRARIDFSLKTLVPLLAILIISYLSAFIPPREFETLCAIQVTALLSSIALYFSTYKPEMQYATTSDKIFIFTYVMITTLLATSILKYVMYRRNYFIKRLALVYQRLLFPLIVLGFSIFIRWL